ncbi:MAG TPA: hypothetical protein VMH81_14010 [Bryobacteraceae bacterium]|nr:hypothetical protein [Bryobacteraceae bacterium]
MADGTHTPRAKVATKAAGAGPGFGDVLAGIIREAGRVKETTFPTITIYVQEDIGVGGLLAKEMNPADSPFGQITGVYIPPSVKPDDSLNVILYMHGDKVRIWDKTGTVRDYWNLPQLPLRQGLKASGKPFILVAPTLGKKAGREFGNLGTNIDEHLDHIMAALRVFGAPEFPLSKQPGVGQLIIAGHSGAYGPISSILKSIRKYKDNITEIWAFDTMYIDMSSLLRSFPVPVYAYFVQGSDTEDNSLSLAGAKRPKTFVMENVDFDLVKGKVKRRPIKHDLLMQRFWLDRCNRIGTDGSDPDDKKRMVHA